MASETNLKAASVTMSDICIDVLKTQDMALKSLGLLISKKDSDSITNFSPTCGGTLGANISRCQMILNNAAEIALRLSSMVGQIG